MKKLLSIAIIIAIMIINVSSVGLSVSDGVNAVKAKFEPDLLEILAETADPTTQIPVVFELADTVDLASIEASAMQTAGVTMEEIESDSLRVATLTDEENIEFQKEVLEKTDALKSARNNLLKNHYTSSNGSFVSANGIGNAPGLYASIFAPFVYANLTPAQIADAVMDDDVVMVSYVGDEIIVNMTAPSINTTYLNVGGDKAISEGYTGSGIRVGMLEPADPNVSYMGSAGNNVTLIDPDNTDGFDDVLHATEVCTIIKMFAPGCTVFSAQIDDENGFFERVETLIEDYNVDVINASCGYWNNGTYTSESRQLNSLIKNTKVPVVIASGNESVSGQLINFYGLAPNAITVGAAEISGNSYNLSNVSCYFENNSVVNKPDVCAPGYSAEYVEDNGYGVTSFATPVVTGTVVQMLCRNSALKLKPQTVKAILMASAKNNCGTDMEYIENAQGTVLSEHISNKEGAGVIDSAFCYRCAKNGRYSTYQYSSSNFPSTVSFNVYADYTSVPLRVAVAWDVTMAATSDTMYNNDFNIRVFKNGTYVGCFSSAPSNDPVGYSPAITGRTNYEIVEVPTSVLQQYGAGYYEVKVYKSGSFQGAYAVDFGIAWEQNW